MAGLPKFPVEGGCLCGAVRYRLTAPPLAVYACHCKDCQRVSNGTHTISMVCNADDAELISGDLISFDKPADSGRTVRMYRCERCGTPVWNAPQASPDLLILKAGTLDDMSWAEPVGNIWTKSKAPWVEVATDGPNYDRQPPNRDDLIAAWAEAHKG